MISFEDLKIYYEDEDIKAFYDEYNTICNPERLLEIAKRGILLYEPLNPLRLAHPYLVDISVLAHQNYMITNIDQYNRMKKLVVSEQYKDQYNNSMVFNLLIINKTFIDFYIYDNEFIEYLMNNDAYNNFTNYNYVRIIHKLAEYGYIDKEMTQEEFSQDFSLLNSSMFSPVGQDFSSSNVNCDASCLQEFEMDSNVYDSEHDNDADELFSSFEKENIENTKELLSLQNYFYLNNMIDEYVNYVQGRRLLDDTNIANQENYENFVNISLSIGSDTESSISSTLDIKESYKINVLNKSGRNTLLLGNINDINMIYFFNSNPHLFNKFDIHATFDKFPINFPIKIMKKYSNVFVNYISRNSFEYSNDYIGELMTSCKNDEFIDILNNFGFINPDVLEHLPLYHKKYINNYEMKTLLSFELGQGLIQNNCDNFFLSNDISLDKPFLSLSSFNKE